jgi:hypothetical protein
MAAHQGEQAAEHDRFDLTAIVGADHSAGERFSFCGDVQPPHDPDGPVLRRFGDRRDWVLAHGRKEGPGGGPDREPLERWGRF